MPKVLIISYVFSPSPTIGSLRPFGLAKYLQDWGWNPIVLTSEYVNRPIYPFTVIETPTYDQLDYFKKLFNYKSIQSNEKKYFQLLTNTQKDNALTIIGSPIAEIINYPDAQKGWYHDAFNVGSKLMKSDPYDAIISTSPPATNHVVAQGLAKKFNVPWIADYRDLWTQFHNYPFSKIRNVFERRFEKKIIKDASALVTVSEPLKERLQQFHKKNKVYSILNGFDPDNSGIGHLQVQNGLTIVYTGSIEKNEQNPTPLFKALRTLSDEKMLNLSDIKVKFYGCNATWLNKSIIKYDLEDIVQIYGRISHEASLKKQQEAQILLHLLWTFDANGVYSGKIFEYLAARRPILSIGYVEGFVIKDLLNQTQAGVQVLNEEEVKEYLLNAYHEFKKFGAVQYHGIEAEIMKYTQLEMSRKFAEVLDEISK